MSIFSLAVTLAISPVAAMPLRIWKNAKELSVRCTPMDEGAKSVSGLICAAVVKAVREGAPLAVSLSDDSQGIGAATVLLTIGVQRSANDVVLLDAILDRADFDERVTAPPLALSFDQSMDSFILRDALKPLLGRLLPWLRP